MWENHTLITAHSGADETGDNSREYLRYVEDIEADCFEVDVRLLSNGSAENRSTDNRSAEDGSADLSRQAAVEAGVSNGSFAGSDSLKDDTASRQKGYWLWDMMKPERKQLRWKKLSAYCREIPV